MSSIPTAASKILGLENVPRKGGGLGHAFYDFSAPLRWYFFAMVAYNVSAYGALAWAVYGHAIPGQRRVLPTGHTPVNQFYAGIALSAILAPASVLLRLISAELSALHPFAVAARSAISIRDLDLIMDPGPLAIRTMLNYSKWFAAVQFTIMLSGILLVPVGTLILTVADYAPQPLRYAVVGLPALQEGKEFALGTAMGGADISDLDRFGPTDLFLPALTAVFVGILTSLPTSLIATPGHLGPTASLNITFEQEVRYNGIVTYDWSGGCMPADDEIELIANQTAGEMTFIFPDQTQNTTNYLSQASRFMWSNGTRYTNSRIPLNGWTYVVQVGPESFTQPPIGRSTVDYTDGKDGLLLRDGAWITRVKCHPSLTWEVSSCVWNGTIMQDCISTPGQNTTKLDTAGLDMLPEYMVAIGWAMYQAQLQTWIHPYQVSAYTTDDINIAYGTGALAITLITTAGYFGTATVPTIGQSSAPVYIVRMPVLVIVTLLLTLVVVMIATDMKLTLQRKLPVRKTSFLTIATAVRGPWWDDELYGKCTFDKSLLRSTTTAKIRFGVDLRDPRNVGFAPIVLPIQRDTTYYGFKTMSRRSEQQCLS
jgi:hypothetical protein